MDGWKRVLMSFAALLSLCAASARAQDQQRSQPPAQTVDLDSVNIEDLMNIKVISVSKTEQNLSRTASAVFVITQEDIRTSGGMSIPDLLRMVPGVDVAQITANTWAIGVRGFNGRFSNKLLVLLDGRSAYTETTSGVFWDVLDLPFENIARIEVIRGPGASVWGANAVDGVINIITKKATETQGGTIEGGGGAVDKGFGTVQYGRDLGNIADVRLYGQYLNQDHLPNAVGQNGGDSWHLLNSGFRADTVLSPKDTLMVQGNLYTGSEYLPGMFLASITSPVPRYSDNLAHLSGGFVQSVWDRVYSPRTDTALQLSYDVYKRDDALGERRKTVNAEFQHHIVWGNRQDILWGLNLRYSSSNAKGAVSVSLNPASRSDALFSTFLQDEIMLVPDHLYLTVGTKLERSPYTGWVAMPSARVAWQREKHQTVWAAISRAVRTPSDTDISIRQIFAGFPGPGGIPAVVGIAGNPNYGNEDLLAYELGYRATISDRLSVDLAPFYNDYTNLQTLAPAMPFLESSPAPLHLFIPQTYENLMHGETHGLDVSTRLQLTRRWTLTSGYAFETIHMHTAPTSQDITTVLVDEGTSPDHSSQLRSHLDLSHGLGWDASAFFVDRLRYGNIASYTRVDTQLSWKWSETGSFRLVGQNLLRDHHLEFVEPTMSIISSQAKRSAYAEIIWRF